MAAIAADEHKRAFNHCQKGLRRADLRSAESGDQNEFYGFDFRTSRDRISPARLDFIQRLANN
jgi:hypothetical protein